MRLNGKRIVVTGGASGIGRAGVTLFAEHGARIVVVDNDEKHLDELAQLGREKGWEIHRLAADLSSSDISREIIEQAAMILGGLDVIWCNAGIAGPREVDDFSDDGYNRAIAINQTSVMMSCSAGLKHLRNSGGGSIIITSSTSGIVGALSSPVYSASKFAVVGWAKSLAQRTARDKIRVNTICPGPCMTPIMRKAIDEGAGDLSGEEYYERLIAGVPLGRFAEPLEIAHAALWLASDESTYVTGIALPVDGGYTCR